MSERPHHIANAPQRAGPGARREPRWGPIDLLDFEPVSRRYRALPREGRGVVWGGVCLAVALLALIVFRQPLADFLWPETRAQELRAQAAAALARGHLTAADGSGARELYEAAIAIDPDRNEARAGLARVSNAALAQAQAALKRDDFPAAHQQLALARELNVPRAQADAFVVALRDREAGVAGILGLLARADAARGQQQLIGDENAALPLYARVLTLRPENIRALEGREDALSDLLQQARDALDAGRLEEGAKAIAAAAAYDAGHAALPEARTALGRATDALRQRAERDLRTGRLGRAAAAYAQLHALDAEDADATRGLRAVADAYAANAERAAADFDFATAQRALEQARETDPQADSIAHAGRRIAEARNTRARSAPRTAGPGTTRRVAALLAEAAAAERRGDLLMPPGESAYDKLRAARALAPDAPSVRQAQARLLPSTRRCFERELPRNNLGQARSCLDAWTALGGEGGATRSAQRRLASRWLAVGDERLGAGEVAGAAAALRAAEGIDPQAPGLDEFRQRLRAARGSVSGQ